MLAIIFNQGINLANVVEKPVYKDYYQVKPEKVLLNGIENAIYLGLLWVEPYRILGTFGIVKILKSGLDVDKTLEGKYAVSLGYSKKYGGLGSEIDGILAEKSVIPEDSIVPISEEQLRDNRIILYPHLSIVKQIVNEVDTDEVLVIGNGILTALIVRALRDKVKRISLYRENEYNIRYEGVEMVRELKREWETVILTNMKSWIRVYLREITKEGGKIIIPRFLKTWPILVYAEGRKIIYVEPMRDNEVFNLINIISPKIFSEIISYSEDVQSSIPTKTPGVLIDFQNFINKFNKNQ